MDLQPTVPPQPQSPTQPVYRSPLFLLTAALIAVMAIGAGGYYLGKRQTKELLENKINPSVSAPIVTSISPTINVDEMRNWKTFINNKTHVTFKYPSSWIVQDDSSAGAAAPDTSYAFYPITSTPDSSFGDHGGNEVFVFSSIEGKYTIEQIKMDNKNVKITKQREFMINGRPAILINSIIKIIDTNRVIHLGYKGEGENYVDQILSTFKFLDENS